MSSKQVTKILFHPPNPPLPGQTRRTHGQGHGCLMSKRKLAETEGAEMILTLCHRSSLLHIPVACKVNSCSFKGREIRVWSTKQIWFERLSLVDLQRPSQVKVPLKSVWTFRLRANNEACCYNIREIDLFSEFSDQFQPVCTCAVNQKDNSYLMNSTGV